jgi:hypothetical protein
MQDTRQQRILRGVQHTQHTFIAVWGARTNY